MARKSRKRLWRGPLPTTGEILRGVVGLFKWKPRYSAQDRTWRKFIKGAPISEETRRDILRELIERVLRGARGLRTPQGQPISREQFVENMERVFVAHASWWDALCARLRDALPVDASEFTNAVALRLAVVELAVRLAPVFVLHAPKLPAWMEEKPEHIDIPEHLLTRLLRELLKHVGVTRNELSQDLNVSKEAVDQWLAQGNIVSAERLDEIAEVIAEKAGEELAPIQSFLRLVRLLTQVFTGLREVVGKEELNWLVEGLWRLTRVAHRELAKQVEHLPEPLRMDLLGQLMGLGSEVWPGPSLRKAMLEQEQDDFWRGVISTEPRQWEQFLGHTLETEQQHSLMRERSKQEGLKYFMADEEQLHVNKIVALLLRSGRVQSPLVEWMNLPPEALQKQKLGLAWEFIQHLLLSEEAGPDAWRELLRCAELYRLNERAEDNAEQRALWSMLSWFSYMAGLAKLSEKMESMETAADLSANAAWVEQVRQALEALPPFPDLEAVTPVLRAILEHLQQMKSTLSRLPILLREVQRVQAASALAPEDQFSA